MKVIDKGTVTIELTAAEISLIATLVGKASANRILELGHSPTTHSLLWEGMRDFYQSLENDDC